MVAIYLAFLGLLLSPQVYGHGAAPQGEALNLYRRETALAYRSLEQRCGAELRKRKAERLAKRTVSDVQSRCVAGS